MNESAVVFFQTMMMMMMMSGCVDDDEGWFLNDTKKELELWPEAITHLGEHSGRDEEEGEQKMRENSGERNR